MATSKQDSELVLPQGQKYHVHFLYSYPRAGQERTPNQKKALDFGKFLAESLKQWGISKIYFHEENALPGTNVFDELSRVSDESVWTFPIITEDFTQNSWDQFCAQHAFKTKLDNNNRNRTVPFLIGEANLPREYNTIIPIQFDSRQEKWKESRNELENLRTVLLTSFSARNPQDTLEEEDAGTVSTVQDNGARTVDSHLATQSQPSIEESPSSPSAQVGTTSGEVGSTIFHHLAEFLNCALIFLNAFNACRTAAIAFRSSARPIWNFAIQWAHGIIAWIFM